MNGFPRETNEPLPFTVLLNGVQVTDPTRVQVATTANRDRPSVWTTPVKLTDDSLALTVAGLLPGVHIGWARITDVPWLPVIELGPFRVE